jgi:hypothetical protein
MAVEAQEDGIPAGTGKYRQLVCWKGGPFFKFNFIHNIPPMHNMNIPRVNVCKLYALESRLEERSLIR